MTEYIYIIENGNTGKFYVGRTNNPDSRRRGHFSELRRGVHGNPRLQASFNKHGEGAFSFHVVDSSPSDQIEAKEAEWFAYFDHDKTYLYNCHFETHGGPKIWKPHTEKSKALISEAIRNGTRKYIFNILDEGYETRSGLNNLAKKHSVGSSTLIRYKSEWEELRGVAYEHPQSLAAKERFAVFAEALKTEGVDVLRRLKDFMVSPKSIQKYGPEFGIDVAALRLDGWKDEAREKAFAAYAYKAKTNCSVQEAMKYAGATTTTYYKYLPEWKGESGAAMSSAERAAKVVEMVKSGITHMHGACKQWRIGRCTVKKYYPEMFA